MEFSFPWPSTADPTWFYLEWASWIISGLLIAWMLIDWMRTDSGTSEDMLTSSREGEIEAVSEKHKI